MAFPSILSLFSGGPSTADKLQEQFLNLSGSTAGRMGASGTRNLDEVSRFYSTLLGGDRSTLARTVAPAANAAREAADVAKREEATRGTARTGGTASTNAQIEEAARKQIGTLVGQAQTGAAEGLKGVSDTELQTMLQSLGIGGAMAQSDINARRAASAEMWAALISGAGKVAAAGI